MIRKAVCRCEVKQLMLKRRAGKFGLGNDFLALRAGDRTRFGLEDLSSAVEPNNAGRNTLSSYWKDNGPVGCICWSKNALKIFPRSFLRRVWAYLVWINRPQRRDCFQLKEKPCFVVNSDIFYFKMDWGFQLSCNYFYHKDLYND